MTSGNSPVRRLRANLTQWQLKQKPLGIPVIGTFAPLNNVRSSISPARTPTPIRTTTITTFRAPSSVITPSTTPTPPNPITTYVTSNSQSSINHIQSPVTPIPNGHLTPSMPNGHITPSHPSVNHVAAMPATTLTNSRSQGSLMTNNDTGSNIGIHKSASSSSLGRIAPNPHFTIPKLRPFHARKMSLSPARIPSFSPCRIRGIEPPVTGDAVRRGRTPPPVSSKPMLAERSTIPPWTPVQIQFTGIQRRTQSPGIIQRGVANSESPSINRREYVQLGPHVNQRTELPSPHSGADTESIAQSQITQFTSVDVDTTSTEFIKQQQLHTELTRAHAHVQNFMSVQQMKECRGSATRLINNYSLIQPLPKVDLEDALEINLHTMETIQQEDEVTSTTKVDSPHSQREEIQPGGTYGDSPPLPSRDSLEEENLLCNDVVTVTENDPLHQVFTDDELNLCRTQVSPITHSIRLQNDDKLQNNELSLNGLELAFQEADRQQQAKMVEMQQILSRGQVQSLLPAGVDPTYYKGGEETENISITDSSVVFERLDQALEPIQEKEERGPSLSPPARMRSDLSPQESPKEKKTENSSPPPHQRSCHDKYYNNNNSTNIQELQLHILELKGDIIFWKQKYETEREERHLLERKIDEQNEMLNIFENKIGRMCGELGDIKGSGRVANSPPNIPRSPESLSKSPPNPPRELLSTKEIDGILPFNRKNIGNNLLISSCGYQLKRIEGFRSGLGVGLDNLKNHEKIGYYFDIRVDETIDTWIGGVGIGITTNADCTIGHNPQKAWKLANTTMLGFWSRLFVLNKEYTIPWNPESLVVGDIVGLQITPGGTLVLYVNGKVQLHVDINFNIRGLICYPVVDVFGGVSAITLQREPTFPDMTQPLPEATPLEKIRTSYLENQSINISEQNSIDSPPR